ncbi:MAG: hypothetical protein AAF938_21520 [Myxococcota bacterium]
MAIDYREPDDESYRAMLLGFGLDEGTALIFSQVCRAMREGAVSASDSAFRDRLGRKAESVDAFLERTFAA